MKMVCGNVENKKERGLKATEQSVGGFNYRPYKPLGRVGQVDSQVSGRH